jgi:hypothetical protein
MTHCSLDLILLFPIKITASPSTVLLTILWAWLLSVDTLTKSSFFAIFILNLQYLLWLYEYVLGKESQKVKCRSKYSQLNEYRQLTILSRPRSPVFTGF